MSKIFKNMVPYWKAVFVILALLLIQAMCDLALPSYTSDIIDVGIQKSGVEHVVPQAVTAEEFETAQLMMTEDEGRLWRNLYEKEGEVYKLTESAQKRWDEMDEKLVLPLILNYQMSAMEESAFKSYAAAQSGMDKAKIDAMSVEELGRMLGVSLTPFEQQKEDEDGNPYTAICVDVRPVFTAMRDAGRMQEDAILSMRQNLQKTIDTMGSSMVRSMGVAYAVACDQAAGLDVNAIQTSYLWRAGLKMLGMALIMGIATVLVSFFASRVGAGIGKNLRDGVFKRVVGFSNAEMDKFSTASLITRSTNDIQQIQMVSAMLLRMVAYAPIMGIGGVIKAMQTGAGMGWIIALALLVILGYVMVLMSASMPK